MRTVRPTKSVSSETTFEDPIASADALSARLDRLCQRVAERLQAQTFKGQTVVLKLKTAGFQTLTRSHTLVDATNDYADIFIAAETMLRRAATGIPYRLIGVGLSNLIEACDFADMALWEDTED